MTKLNQLIAVAKDVKGAAHRDTTVAYHQLQKAPLLSGIARSYSPRDEDGETLPGESTRVQLRAADVLKGAAVSLSRFFDITGSKDETNMTARADIVVDGNVLVEDVPVTTLLFLEKQLVDLHTIISKLPVLDPAETWEYSAAQNCWATPPVQTVRSKKIPRNHVKAAATDKHPAQVEIWYEDVTVGTWSTIKYSGAVPATRVAQILERVAKLQAAVKFAREEANGTEVTDFRIGDKIFGYLLAE